MLSSLTTADAYFQLLRGLPAAIRADLINRLVASLVAEVRDETASPAAAIAPAEPPGQPDAGFGGWRDTTPDDYAEQLRAARTPNTRPIPEW